MKRIYALALGLVVLLATPGLAAADITRPANSQQTVQYVIARALSQRGVPFSFGGGDVNGPTRGSGPTDNAIGLDRTGRVVGLDPAASVVGFDASGLVLYSFAGESSCPGHPARSTTSAARCCRSRRFPAI